MAILPVPQNLLDEHHNWHAPGSHAGPGNRQRQFGTPGGGLEFLQFHGDFVRRVRTWYLAQPGANPALVESWTTLPAAYRDPMRGWNNTLSTQENRIVGNPTSFASVDALGEYIEGGIHNYLHNAGATIFNEPVLASFHSPQSSFFYQIHGLIDNWWRAWESAQQPQQVTALVVNAAPVQASIGRAGEIDIYSFEAATSSRFSIGTEGQADLVASLYGPTNLATFITEDDDSGPGNNPLIERNLTPGTYYVRVRHYSAQATGQYRMFVRSQEVSIPPIPVNGAAVNASIASPGETDLFTFTVATAGFHTIETAGSTDTYATLAGPGSQTAILAEDDDSGPDTNARIVADLQPGNYFVSVRHYSSSGTGPYSITVRR